MGNLALATLETVKIVPLTAVPLFTIDTKHDHEICQAVSAITTLAILSSDVLHIETEYTASIKGFAVKVFDAGTDYMLSHPRKFGRSIYLDSADALLKLNQLEDLLIELVGAAKDKSTGAI